MYNYYEYVRFSWQFSMTLEEFQFMFIGNTAICHRYLKPQCGTIEETVADDFQFKTHCDFTWRHRTRPTSVGNDLVPHKFISVIDG